MQFAMISECCSDRNNDFSARTPDPKQRFVTQTVSTAIGKVPAVSTRLTGYDRWGTLRVRWGVGRMAYRVDPGLYAVGSPSQQSPVLVSSNYKMSFDRLREVLSGRDAWILVLDTKGINVWCAAGKGTFGTDELVARIESSGIEQVVGHRQLILPQLAGPGISAHRVKQRSGFEVVYGPIRARDLPFFLDNGLTVEPHMRLKTFLLRERIALVPIELVAALKAALFVVPVFFLGSGFGGGSEYWSNTLIHGRFAVVALLAAILSGAVLTPVLLPWLPGRAFSTKGLTVGLSTALVVIFCRSWIVSSAVHLVELISWLFLIPAVSTYLAMNFTGASTFTSLSGVRKEMRWAVPLEITLGFIGISLWIGSRFVS